MIRLTPHGTRQDPPALDSSMFLGCGGLTVSDGSCWWYVIMPCVIYYYVVLKSDEYSGLTRK